MVRNTLPENALHTGLIKEKVYEKKSVERMADFVFGKITD